MTHRHAVPSRPVSSLAILVLTTCSIAQGLLAATQAKSPAVESQEPRVPQATDEGAAAQDLFDDPLPEGATLRLGTTRLRQRQGVEGVAFSPDGTQLVSTGWGDSIRFWDVKTGRQIRRLKTANGEGTFAVAFSPDGQLLASVGERGSVRLWDLGTGELQFNVVAHVRHSHGARVYGVAFSPDGSTFATAGADSSVRIWDVASGTVLLELQDEGGYDAHAVVFSPNGDLLATGSGKGGAVIKIWNLNSGGEPKIIDNAHERDITSLVFVPDGKRLISSGVTLERTGERSVRFVSQIRMWDVASGKEVGQFAADEDLLGSCSLAISKDGRVLCSSHHDKVVVWDVATCQPTRIIEPDSVQHGGRTHGLAVSPDGTLVGSRAFDDKVHLWDAASGTPVLKQEKTHVAGVISVQFSPDGSQIATGSEDATVRMWDANSGQHLRIVSKSSGWICYVEFLPDGEHIALGAQTRLKDEPYYGGEVKISRVADGKIVQRFPVAHRVWCGDISTDGTRIAAAIGLLDGEVESGKDSGFSVHVWELPSGEELGPSHVGENRILQVAFAPDGNQVWSVSDTSDLYQWDVQSGDELHSATLVPEDEKDRYRRLVLAPDMTFVVAGGLRRIDRESSLGVLEMRRTKDGEPLWNKTLTDRWPSLLATSPDGRVVAGYLRALWRSRVDNRITLWSADRGEELHSFDLDDGAVRSLAFSPDGKRLVSGMDRGHALVWDLSVLQLE